ncbi:MAG: LpxI family protein, partial [Planctomycetota bacterium]|nr:LpxI family protein [Planctomycetota bacterium]
MVRDDPNRIGLVAGWGRFPIVLAETLRAHGYHVTCLGIKGHADPVLAEICDEFVPVGIAKLGRQIRLLRNRGVTKATMAGKLFKTILFKRFAWLKHSPDWTCVRYFYPLFITKTRTRTDDSLLLTVVQAYADAGICFAPATDFAPELLVKTGTLSQRKLTNYEAKDI